MVTITIEPHAAGVGTLGIAFVTSLLLEHIVTGENLGFVEFESRTVVADKVSAEHHLVEEIPFTLVFKCSGTLFAQDVPPWVIKVCRIFYITLFCYLILHIIFNL